MTSFYVITAGCALNFADSEQMAGLLKQAKFDLAENEEKADILIFNTCTVKTPTESAFYTRLKETKEKYPYKIIIITGCIPQTDISKLKQYALVGTKQIHNIVQVVEEALHDNVLQLLENEEMPPLNLPRVRKNPLIEILPINRGCLGACAFCKTKAARGNLVSYPIAEIIKEAETALKEGVKEIWLTAQDTGCYGFDLNTNLPALLKELIKLPYNFKMRLGMMNPEHTLKIKDELFPLLKNQKMFQFLHIPVQSGSNQLLKKMVRNYTAEEFEGLIQELKSQIPEINLMTDLIVGFPGESEEDHWKTLELLRKTNPDEINISRFWPRPKTAAAKMEQLPDEVITQRIKVVTDIFYNIAKIQNERWLGWEGNIIIDEKGEGEQWIGRNYTYKPVIVKGDFSLGQVLPVKIVSVGKFDLKGEVLK